MNEEALLLRAAEERERIFQRYERGRDNLVGQIDPWEDPEFEDYHKTDRLVNIVLVNGALYSERNFLHPTIELL